MGCGSQAGLASGQDWGLEVERSGPPIGKRVLEWWHRYGRKNLPWQREVSPYRTWVAEVMLQQTQVNTVIPYFDRFIHRFPSIADLAVASLDEVLVTWAGLGYYARARNLHKAAGIIMVQYSGALPQTLKALQSLPGIGRSTAGAILAQAFGLPAPILDGNAKRVLCRYHAVSDWPGEAATARKLWRLAEYHTPHDQAGEYTQAIMDLGALICTRRQPKCEQCPAHRNCRARQQGRQQVWPVSRARSPRPMREAWYLVLRNQAGWIGLYRRPLSGIWGGLWCFPEFKSCRLVQAWLNEHWPIGKYLLRNLPIIKHEFTHFHLRLHPLLTDIKAPISGGVQGLPLVWYKPGSPRPGGFPVPVDEIIDHIDLAM